MADTSPTIDQQFVEYIVKSLVGDPDAVSVKRSIDEKGVLLELTVAPDDLGRVIGKRGNTAQSIRTLLRALGTKNDARYNLKIVDVNGNSGGPRRDDAPATDQAAPAAPVSTDDTTADDADNADDTPATAATEEVNPWAHLASAKDEAEAAAPADTAEEDTPDEDKGSSVVEKTRKELEDLADLNI